MCQCIFLIKTPYIMTFASVGLKPLMLSVLASCSTFTLLFSLFVFMFSSPTWWYISVNLTGELISQSGLQNVILTEEGKWTWHLLQRICRISALTKQSIHSHITFHLPQGVNPHCVLNRRACSDQFCLLDDCWVYSMLQMVPDNSMGCHVLSFFDDLMLNVLNRPKYV